ncbi:hypothetical protein HPB48_023293 [Haemaphysalis longicornis]|uniref:Transposable element P transposase-like GTP-binding insertion domain-containing protein n=1 Tax=Haemaphysalis longicornis TaxID=44386 RepID=A0A9J6H6M2_HAELO|nr:hypothetical protein HPB48_023293 [Haemaphysalis longicornis]
MPKITNAHLEPNSFDKMKVDLAFQLFSDQVIKALFIYREHIRSSYETVQPTEDFVKRNESPDSCDDIADKPDGAEAR